ncbi:MAG: anti-sigma factor [Lachnospiraceae bacterium]|nr:anti-sigma factor [Lachnospiraceae bacterium]
MSKNFEEEYRQMIDSELPDLWDRIEAQLPKAAAAMPAVSEQTEASISGTVKMEEAVPVRRKRHFHNRWMPAVIVGAAALIFVIAAFPVLFLPRSKSDESERMNEAEGCADNGGAMDMGDDPNMYMYCEAADYDEIPQEETAAAIQEFDEDSKSGNFDGTTETAAPSAMEDAAQNSINYDDEPVSGSQSNDETEPEAEEMNSEEAPDLYQIEVQILDRMITEEGETFYEAVVLQNGGNGYQKGIRMYFRFAREDEARSDSADVSLQQGEKYILSLYASGEMLESYGIESKDGELYGEEMYIVYEIIKN